MWSRIESLGALYAVWAPMGLAMAATLYKPAFAAIVGWFPLKDRVLVAGRSDRSGGRRPPGAPSRIRDG